LLILSFSIDSQALSQPYRVTTSSAELVAEIGQEPNSMLYSYDFITPGEHTLVVNVSASINTTFRFDYLTYVPTFARLADMPAEVGGSGGSSSSGTGSSGGRQAGSIIGAAVGVVIGSVLLGVLCFLFLRRRARRRERGVELIGSTGDS
jgi:hypothetical protein